MITKGTVQIKYQPRVAWECKQCKKSGEILIEDPLQGDIAAGVEAAMRAHTRESPKCIGSNKGPHGPYCEFESKKKKGRFCALLKGHKGLHECKRGM